MTRNVVLICLDTARRDLFDEYATRLQDWAEVSFDQCRAASSWSVPSHASMFTGMLPSEHGIHSHNPSFADLDREDTFLADLDGYTTLGFSANAYASSAFEFDTLFDTFADINRFSFFNDGLNVPVWYRLSDTEGPQKYVEFLREALLDDYTLKSIANGISHQLHHILPEFGYASPCDDGARQILRNTRRVLSETSDPVFIFANFMETHSPRSPRRSYDESIHELPGGWSHDLDTWEVNTSDNISRFEETFEEIRRVAAAEMDYVDRKIVEYIEMIQHETDGETTFVITADHGENLGYPDEDYLWAHTSSVSEALLHVPMLLVNPPEGYDSTEQRLFSHTELADLISGLADGRAPDLFRDRIVAENVGICSSHRGKLADDELSNWDRMIRCAYRDTQKVEWDTRGTSRRFELDPQSPSSQREVETDIEVPEWATALFDTDIDEYKERAIARDTSDAVEEGMSDATLQRLESLGYA